MLEITSILFSIFPLLIILPKAHGSCGAVISEINTNQPIGKSKSDFIELEFRCTDMNEIPHSNGYKVLVISGRNGVVEFYANLIDFKQNINSRQFYTIGNDETVPSINMGFGHARVHYRQKQLGPTQTTIDVMKSGNNAPRAVILIFLTALEATIFDGKLKMIDHKEVRLDEGLRKFIKQGLRDIIVYGRETQLTKCTIFEELYDKFKNVDYLLRDYNTKQTADSSINRCTEAFEAFQPMFFKIGRPTPGSANDCSGSYMTLDQMIHQSLLSNPILTPVMPPVEELTSDQHARTSVEGEFICRTSHIGDEVQIEEEDVVEMYTNRAYEAGASHASPNQCPEAQFQQRAMIGMQTNIINGETEEPARKRLKKVIESEIDDWDTDKYFRSEWMTFLRQQMSDRFSIEWLTTNPDWKKWIVIKPDQEKPENTIFQCRICLQNHDKMGFKVQEKSNFAKPTGVTLGPKKHKNREKFLEHVIGRSAKNKGKKTGNINEIDEQESMHNHIIDKLELAKGNRMKTNVEQLIQAEQQQNTDGRLTATANMFRAVYAEAILNVPLQQHEIIVKLLKANQANMGTHHYEATSASRMLHLMSNAFHRRLLRHLTSSRFPASLILDATTDGRGNHYVILYIKSLEEDKDADGKVLQIRPVLYFYKLIELGIEETADAYMNALEQTFDEEMEKDFRFTNYIKKNLVGFGSDGASVMLGKSKGLIVKIRNFVEIQVASTHCLAHRLHLATGRAWKQHEMFQKFEKIINRVYLFYNNRGHKRKAHLKATAFILEEVYYDYNQIFAVRWIGSEYQAVSKVNKTMHLLLTDLSDIMEGNEFSQQTKKDAGYLYDRMREKNFISFLKFVLDILNLFSAMSAKLQSQYGVVVDKADLFTSFKENLRNRKTSYAKEEMKLYAQAMCKQSVFDEQESCKDLKTFETSAITSLHGISLKNTQKYPKLTDIREAFIETLLVELESYFPQEEFAVYQPFEPRKLPSNTFEVESHASMQSVVTLAANFGLEPTIADEWSAVLTKIIESDAFQRLRTSNTVEFYSTYLADTNIPWTQQIKRLIMIIIVIPIGSADAERGFSILKHIKYDRRSRLGLKSLNAYLRLRINGPSIESFNALPYAALWVNTGHCRSDSEDIVAPRRNINKEEIEFEKDNEFLFEFEIAFKKFFPKSCLF